MIRHSQDLRRPFQMHAYGSANNNQKSKINENNLTYKILNRTFSKNNDIVLKKNLAKQRGIFSKREKKKKNRDLVLKKKGGLSPSRGDRVFSSSPSVVLPPSPLTRVTCDSAVRSPVSGRRGRRPHLRPAGGLSNSRVRKAEARRHHRGPWCLWFL